MVAVRCTGARSYVHHTNTAQRTLNRFKLELRAATTASDSSAPPSSVRGRFNDQPLRPLNWPHGPELSGAGGHNARRKLRHAGRRWSIALAPSGCGCGCITSSCRIASALLPAARETSNPRGQLGTAQRAFKRAPAAELRCAPHPLPKFASCSHVVNKARSML